MIAGSVLQSLKERLDAMESGNPFEERSWSGEENRDPARFDFADIPDLLDPSGVDPGAPMPQIGW